MYRHIYKNNESNDFIERKKDSYYGEVAAQIAIGEGNKYLGIDIKNNKPYIYKDEQIKYLENLENNDLEKEINNLDTYLKKEIEKENYNSRLKYSIENSFVDIDLNCENITWKENLWNGILKYVLIDMKKREHFSLYDVYLTIEKTDGDFTCKDIINLINFRIEMEIGGCKLIQKEFLPMCLLELLENQEILIQPNLLYIKAFTFENFKYGISKYLMKYHDIKFISRGLNSNLHSNYKIDIIFSGKDLSSLNINEEDFKGKQFNQVVILSQSSTCENIISKQKINLNYNNPTSVLMFFLYDNLDNNFDDTIKLDEPNDLQTPDIDAIGLQFNNNSKIWWEQDELIKVNFLGINLYIVCIDPQLRNYNKFISYIKNDIEPQTIKSINFSRFDKVEAIVEYSNSKSYNLFISGLHTNLFQIASGMGWMRFCS